MTEDRPLSEEEKRPYQTMLALETFHFRSRDAAGRDGGGGIPRIGTTYMLNALSKPEEPAPADEAMQVYHREKAIFDYFPYEVQIITASQVDFRLRGQTAREFLLWFGGMVACPACVGCHLTFDTNNEECPTCGGKLLRTYDALVWMRSQVDFAAGDWTTLGAVPPGTLFILEDGIRAVKSEYTQDDGRPECILLASGEYTGSHVTIETRVRPIHWSLPTKEST